jgi:hypothetical protein
MRLTSARRWMTVLLVIAAAFLALGSYRFTKREV